MLYSFLLTYRTERRARRAIALGQPVGTVVPKRNSGVALEQGFYTMDAKLEQLTPLVDPERHLPGKRFNDGKRRIE